MVRELRDRHFCENFIELGSHNLSDSFIFLIISKFSVGGPHSFLGYIHNKLFVLVVSCWNNGGLIPLAGYRILQVPGRRSCQDRLLC